MFNFNDMSLFHKIVYKTIPVYMSDYLTIYSGKNRLRRTQIDDLSFVSNVASTTTSINNVNKSFFFRSHVWNSLPFDIMYKKFNGYFHEGRGRANLKIP